VANALMEEQIGATDSDGCTSALNLRRATLRSPWLSPGQGRTLCKTMLAGQLYMCM
jgi:hypothetical protein